MLDLEVAEVMRGGTDGVEDACGTTPRVFQWFEALLVSILR